MVCLRCIVCAATGACYAMHCVHLQVVRLCSLKDVVAGSLFVSLSMVMRF